MRALPELLRCFDWLREGGRPEELDEGTRARLRALDREYQDLGASPPLWPLLTAAPGAERGLGPIGAAALDLPEATRVRGWLAAQVTALEQLVVAFRAAERDVGKVLPQTLLNADSFLGTDGVPPTMSDRDFAVGLFLRQSSHGRKLASLRVHRVIPGQRSHFRALMRPAERASEALIYAGLRSYAEEPATRDHAARLLAVVGAFRMVPMGRWVSIPTWELVGWVPGADVPVTYAALRSAFRRAKRFYQVDHDLEEDLRALVAALQRIPAGPDHRVGQDLARDTLAILVRDLVPTRADELGRARFVRILWPHAAWDPQAKGAGLRRLLAVLAFEGRGAEGVDEDILRLLRREISHHPRPREQWYERARDALLARDGLAP
jgi:hypothetical protein